MRTSPASPKFSTRSLTPSALLAFFFSAFVLSAVMLGCSGGGSTSGAGGTRDHANVGSVIIGVSSDLRVGVDIDKLRVRMWVGDKAIKDEVLSTAGGGAPLKLPAEFPFVDVDEDELVKVELEAFRAGDDTTPLVTRAASTRVIPSKKLLLRVGLDALCAMVPGVSGPTCAAEETCVAGACKDPLTDPKSLPPYDASWSEVTNDICKPAGGGEPSVTVGQGQADYLPMSDLDEAQVEAGPQGGHHVWVAIRMKNLLQSGSLTRVTGQLPELGVNVPAMQVIFSFDQDEGGYCKLYGLRFQLDQQNDIQTLLGHVLKVTVQVTDKDGDVGLGERIVTLSKDIR